MTVTAPTPTVRTPYRRRPDLAEAPGAGTVILIDRGGVDESTFHSRTAMPPVRPGIEAHTNGN